MPTLNELLDIDLTYQEILDQLEEETDGFTVMDGEVAFSSQFEFETAKTILENHYEEVKEKGLDVVNDEGESAFTLEFSSPFVDDFDFPDEVEESLNEEYELEEEPNIDLNRDTVYNFKTFDEFYDWVQRL